MAVESDKIVLAERDISGALNDINFAEIEAIVAETGNKSSDVIPILQAIQSKYHYLPEQALRHVCELTEISPATITGVATFYAQFRLKPAGKYTIKVCVGTACHVMGAETLYDSFRQELKLKENEDTDSEGIFTVEKLACLGCCMLASAIQIDQTTYGNLTTKNIPNTLADFLSSQNGSHVPHEVFAPWNGRSGGEIRMCLCSSCSASGAKKVHSEISNQVKRFRIPARIKTVGCTGMAYQAPLINISINRGRTYQYGRVRPQDTQVILFDHFKPASAVSRGNAAISRFLEKLIYDVPEEPITRYAIDTRFGPDAMYVGPQRHIVTELNGNLNPLDIDEYVESGGFGALEKCLKELTPEEIITEIKRSGLRGRGGAGFPTGTKWGLVAKASSEVKYIICNGDEGDPGAFMDRMVLESFPFRVIEGMLIASCATGGTHGYVYIRAEYPLALQNMQRAIKRCEEKGILGDDILRTGFSFELKVFPAAGAFVCGEETALIASIEGGRGMPKLRPPFPADQGLWGKPTLVNNVETFAVVPWIMRNGAETFASIGNATSKGTKTFALAGKINRSGLIEVPMGLTLREIVEEIGGGIKDGKKLKAIQVGGPSGGCIPAWLADTPVDYEALNEVDAIMGSGGMIVLDEDDCMVDIARYFMSFTQNESCGKCTFCRIGTKRILEILEALCRGEGREGDLEKLEELAHSTMTGSLCNLGKTAPNPVLSTLRHFRDEYQSHIEKKCPAGKCKELISYSITDECIGCTKCAQGCAPGAIEMKPYEKHIVDMQHCTRCDVCRQVCPVDAVLVA